MFYLHVCMYTTFMPDVWGGQNRASESGIGVQWVGAAASVWRAENSLWELVLPPTPRVQGLNLGSEAQ